MNTYVADGSDIFFFFFRNTPEMPLEFRSFSFFPSSFHSELTISFHKVKGNAYLNQLWRCWENEAVRKQFRTNSSHFGVRVMQGAKTDRPPSVKNSGKAIPRSLPIINITHVATNAMDLTDKFFGSCPAHPNPLIRSIGNYSLADLHRQYKKYIHKRPKHILL